MTLSELDSYFNSFLKKENFSNDISLNGIQIQNSNPNKDITKVAFAVDASLDSVKKAAQEGAGLLFVHHGLFWGQCQTITNVFYERVAEFIKNDIALYASHIPLDANEEIGNNFGMAKIIGLKNVVPFAQWRGMTLGAFGRFEKPISIEELEKRVMRGRGKASCVLPFGKKEIQTVAIVSGGASEDHVEAAALNADAFVTGEVMHEDYNAMKEEKLNVIGAGHYNSETVGVQLVAEKLKSEKSIETIFIDFPTGL